MLEDLGPLLKNLPPRTATALVQAINRCGEELDIGPDWVQRWIGFTVVADALTRYSPEGEPVFELKGGAAIKMRLGDPFVEAPAPPFMRRFRIHVTFHEERFGRLMDRDFSNVKLEVSLYEGRHRSPELVPAFSLKPFGLEGPRLLPCIPLTKQVAQWSEPLEQLAKEMGLPNETAAEIVQHVTEYIQRIAAYPPDSKRTITPSVPTA